MPRLVNCLAVLSLAAVCGTAPVRAQTGDWAKIVDAARKEGEVIVWGQSGEGRRKFWKDSFEKAYPGILVTLFQPANSSERDSRYIREYEAKVAKVDVFVAGTGGLVSRVKPGGMLQPLRPLLRDDVLASRNWIDGEPLWGDEEKQYVITSDQTVTMPVVGSMALPADAIRSWGDLLDAKWNGKIVSLDPRAGGMAFAASLFAYMYPALGPDFVSNLYAKGRIVFGADERQMLEWVEAGRVQLAFAIREPEVAGFEKIGVKFRTWTTLEAGGIRLGITAGNEGVAAVPNLEPLPHPNAARVYLNWFFSKEGQQAMVDALGIASSHTGVDMKALNPRLVREPGAKYGTAADERVIKNTRAMRDAVSKAVEAR